MQEAMKETISMWRRFGQRITKRGEAAEPPPGIVGKVRERFGRQETGHAQTAHGGALTLGVGALAVVATIALLLLLRRRAASQRSSTEEASEEVHEESEQ
jgi:hypothetical protein